MADMEYIDFDAFNALGMDVVLEKDMYNLQIIFFKLAADRSLERGMMIRTTIFEATISDISKKIQSLFDLNIFGNLDYLSVGHVLTQDAEIIDKVDWNEYLRVNQEPSRIIH